MLLQPKQDFERFSIVLLRMNKQIKIVLLLFKKESRRRWNTHKTLTFVNLLLVLFVCPFYTFY